MSTIRVVKDKENPYSLMSKLGIQDCGLSFKATGLLTYLLALPDDWEIQVSDLINRKTDKDTSVTSAIKELLDHGYMVRGERKRTPMGGLAGYNYELYESSLNGYVYRDQKGKLYNSQKKTIGIEKSYTGKSQLGKSYLGKSQDSKYTDKVNNKKSNSNITIVGEDKKNIEYIDPDVFFLKDTTTDVLIIKFTKHQYSTVPGVKYQIDKKGIFDYIGGQIIEFEKLLKEMAEKNLQKAHLEMIIDYVLQDSFWVEQIGSIGKLRKKNKEGIPYRVVMVGKVKHKFTNTKKVTDLSFYKS